MMKPVNIIIDDENRYFAAGLRHIIMQYALTNNKTVCFLTSCREAQPDIVIASAPRRAQRWQRTGFNGAIAPVVTIKERCFSASKAKWVLYRTDERQRFFELLGEVLKSENHVSQSERRMLTFRERQVMNYLRNGFDQSQTAVILGISVKTVHSHKRSVMSKLSLKRNHDFIYWLLAYGENYLNRG